MKNKLLITKRDGSVVDFDENKIIDAIMSAMKNAGDEDVKCAMNIANKVKEKISQSDYVNVEDVQDIVEVELMDAKKYDTAKEYVLYRDERRRSRTNGKRGKYRYLSDEFLSKYKHKTPNMTDFGSFVYLRTYSRYLEEGRREQWWETVARAVDYNMSLVNNGSTKAEAEKLYDNIFNLKQFLSGRTFWTGNTQAAKLYPMSNFNCAFVVVDNFEVYEEIFYASMVGSGVGFRILPEDVEKLPAVRTNLNVVNKTYMPVAPHKRKQNTCIDFVGDVCEIVIGDSKESWCEALHIFLKLHYSSKYRNINNVIIDYNNVRPAGEMLKTFGGTSSGHESMLIMIEKISKLIKRDSGVNDRRKLKPIDAMDIANIISENVVSGGVRRSAQITLFDANDREVLEAKKNLYVVNDKGEWVINKEISHRSMSNNSVLYRTKPTRQQIRWQLEQMRYNGEPAFINYQELKRRRPDAEGVNPCGEILLASQSMCNLTTVNLAAFVREDNTLDKEALLEAQRLSARAGYRMACIELELHDWNMQLENSRLIGCSMTGIQDMLNITEMSEEEEIQLYKDMRQAVHDEIEVYAKQLGQKVPDAMTTIKPEGTLSCLPSVSSGIHYPESEYYIRRVRINAADPLCKLCEELGYPVFPEVGSTHENAKTKVVEFTLKSPMSGKGKTKHNVTAIEQLNNYLRTMRYYTDHNTSITVTVRDDEWEQVEEWMLENWDEVVGVSFLPLSDAVYQLLPYEAISKEEYEKRTQKKMKKIDAMVLKKFENKNGVEDDLIEDPECASGACPVR